PQQGRLRRPGSSHFHESFMTVVGKCLMERTFANPIDVAQYDAAHAQRLTRADDYAAALSVEPYHIERCSGRDTQPAALADSKVNNAGMHAKHLAVEIDNLAAFGRARLQPFDHV